MELLPRDVVLLGLIGLPSIEEQTPLCLVLVCHCYLEMKDLLLSHHKLEQEVGLHQVEILLRSWVCRELSLGGVLKEHDETLAGLIIGFLDRPTETPAAERLLVYRLIRLSLL